MTDSRRILVDRTRFGNLMSFSGVDQFSTCERRFYFERILRRRQPDTAITLVGRTYHEAIAAMLDTRVERTDEWATFVSEEAVARNHEGLTKLGVACGSLVHEMSSNLRRLRADVLDPVGIRTVYDVVKYGRRWAWWIERSFKEWSVGYKGVIDLLTHRTPVTDEKGRVTGFEEARCVWDWKSVTSDRRRSQRDAETSAQLALYAIAANVRHACFVELPRNLEKDVRVRVVRYSEADLRDWTQWLLAMREAVLSRGKVKSRFRPADRKNPLCSPMWCPHYVGECYPAAPGTLLTPTPDTVTVDA